MSVIKNLESYMAQKVAFLSTDTPGAKALLARLRRAAGKNAEETPDVWEITLDNIPDSLSGRYYDGSYHPSVAEQAVHISLTLFALQAQGSTGSPQEKGVSLGRAAGILSSRKDNDSIKTRFSAIISASDLSELAHHLRGMAQMFRSEGGIGMDYVMLVRDLYLFSNTDWRNEVIFRWGEDFFSRKYVNDSETKDKEE